MWKKKSKTTESTWNNIVLNVCEQKWNKKNQNDDSLMIDMKQFRWENKQQKEDKQYDVGTVE